MSRALAIGLGVAGLAGAGGVLAVALIARKKQTDLVRTIEAATKEPEPATAATPGSPRIAPRAPKPAPSIPVRLTKYHPWAAKTEAEKRMEGGTNDRKGKPLIPLEKHLADPARYPYASVAGDDAIWPYGQRVSIDAFPGAVFRVVDTGGNFRGANKVYRLAGHEPFDICVEDKGFKIPTTASATIFSGDNFAKGAQIAAAKLPGSPSILGADHALGIAVLAAA